MGRAGAWPASRGVLRSEHQVTVSRAVPRGFKAGTGLGPAASSG